MFFYLLARKLALMSVTQFCQEKDSKQLALTYSDSSTHYTTINKSAVGKWLWLLAADIRCSEFDSHPCRDFQGYELLKQNLLFAFTGLLDHQYLVMYWGKKVAVRATDQLLVYNISTLLLWCRTILLHVFVQYIRIFIIMFSGLCQWLNTFAFFRKITSFCVYYQLLS